MTDGGFHFFQHGRFGAMSEPEEGRHGHGLCQGSGIAGILGNPRFQRPFLVGERVEVKGRRQFPLAMGVVQESVVVQMVVNIVDENIEDHPTQLKIVETRAKLEKNHHHCRTQRRRQNHLCP